MDITLITCYVWFYNFAKAAFVLKAHFGHMFKSGLYKVFFLVL